MDQTRWQRVKDVFSAARERPPDARPAFLTEACGGDTGLRREVESLLAAHSGAGAFLSEPAARPIEEGGLEGRRIGPYRVLSEAGRGGMGFVYRAVRDDQVFTKTVALKLVRGGATAEHLRRLAKEREILGRLQHPNIATILDGGTSEEGQPYLVMEYVEGEAIDAYCERRRLATRERLTLFRTVCAAVHYAHQNLVVHRDLKPSNVLVTAEGEVKLLDFGIAKLLAAGLDPDEAPTASLLPVLTPAYASPEQARGQPVTTASDVYSLGVVLYELLTGALPCVARGASLDEMMRAVCETPPVPPSAARTAGGAGPRTPASDLRGDLDTIVLRALSKEPARRYASAQELADDIGRYLGGRPVRARADTLRYRTRKFVGRHRTAVAATAVVVASLIVALFAAVRGQRIAERHQARAEKRFADVRKLAGAFLFDFDAAIQNLPGSTPARRLVVEKALEYLDSLAQEAGGDPILQAELATAYQKVGDVQGNPFGANLGDTAGAIGSYRKEVGIRELLSAGQPGDRRAARDLAMAYCRLGLVVDEGGKTRSGADYMRRSRELAQTLLAQDPGDDATRRVLAHAHLGAGLLELKAGNHAASEEHQRRALAIWEAEAQKSPNDQEALRGVHRVHGHLAWILRVTGRLPEATDHYQRALAAAERRLQLSPADLVARRDQAIGHTNLAIALFRQRNLDQAARHIARSLAFDEEMLRADPRNTQAQRDVSWDLRFMAELAAARGNGQEALALQRRSLEMDAARAAASPGHFQARKDLAENWSAVGDRLSRLGRWEEALEASREAVQMFDVLRASNPEHARVQQLLASEYAAQGEMIERVARRGRAASGPPARGVPTPPLEACRAFQLSLDSWRDLEKKGSIDADQRSRRGEMEKAVERCRPVLARR